ncbi:MAG: hypothetical protein ABIN68_06830 [Sphingomicrobium sp.]
MIGGAACRRRLLFHDITILGNPATIAGLYRAMEVILQSKFFLGVSTLALFVLPAPVVAQHSGHMPGMKMPGTAKPAPKKNAVVKKPIAKKKAAARKASAKKAATRRPSAKSVGKKPLSSPQPSSGPDTMGHSATDHGAMPMPVEPAPTPGAETPTSMDHLQMEQGSMDHAAMAGGEHTGHTGMKGALGPYAMEREASGTAWQPDASEHTGLMRQAGDWLLMGHGVLNLVYDQQSGRRGAKKAFASGMLMGTARRPLGNGTLQFKAMVSPDPLMGKGGYPLLLASGETANGVDRLIDRQHPHDVFMELSGSVSQNVGPNSSVFLYAALPGEPAFGPPAFMHRGAILESPEAPITHHWLDSTHISFGVLTAGVIFGRAKLEISRFNGREPDQHRWNIESGPLDSTAVRLSWNPTAELALQASWGHFTDPEQLEPGVDQKRWSASALYARDFAPNWKLAGTLAWGRKVVEGHSDDAFALEASLKHGSWTLFGRGERTENRELVESVAHGPAYRVGKISLGAVRDFRVADHVSLGLGGLVAANFVPDPLAQLYGGHHPTGVMGFARVKLD